MRLLPLIIATAITVRLDSLTASEVGWSSLAGPAPLSAIEEASPQARALTRLFNPAMALPDADLWPVSVSYAWSDGADLIARVKDDAGGVVDTYTARSAATLSRLSWADLPLRDDAGRRIDYYVDAPGSDEPLGTGPSDDDDSDWKRQFAARARAGQCTPTQYAHAFWWNRARGLLAIQYWFYYPFNEWVNRHEGDWEHVNVILAGDSTLDHPERFHPVGYQFFFHDFMVEPRKVHHLGGTDPQEDHVVVYVGGKGSLLAWAGNHSGGSYPLPGVYKRAGVKSRWVSPDEDVSRVGHFLQAQRFDVVVLPEPDRLDAHAHPELSWLPLSFYLGQLHVARNPPLYRTRGSDHPPQQPAHRSDWNARRDLPHWKAGFIPSADPGFAVATVATRDLPSPSAQEVAALR